jgi:hypothetical protein
MYIISVNISDQPHCRLRDKQKLSDNRNYIIRQFATLQTCISVRERFSTFNKTHRYIRQRYKNVRCDVLYIKKPSKAAIVRQWNSEKQAAEISMWCCSKKTDNFVIFCLLDMRLIAVTC